MDPTGLFSPLTYSFLGWQLARQHHPPSHVSTSASGEETCHSEAWPLTHSLTHRLPAKKNPHRILIYHQCRTTPPCRSISTGSMLESNQISQTQTSHLARQTPPSIHHTTSRGPHFLACAQIACSWGETRARHGDDDVLAAFAWWRERRTRGRMDSRGAVTETSLYFPLIFAPFSPLRKHIV